MYHILKLSGGVLLIIINFTAVNQSGGNVCETIYQYGIISFPTQKVVAATMLIYVKITSGRHVS